MTSQFSDDLSRLRAEFKAARDEFLGGGRLHFGRQARQRAARRLGDPPRTGPWLSSEQSYARLIAHLRQEPITDAPPPSDPASMNDAKEKLSVSRATLLDAAEGVSEDAFYTIGQIGHEEYSVMSILENARSHDHEHGGQLVEILRTS